jgi:thiamine pyrophosphokinase
VIGDFKPLSQSKIDKYVKIKKEEVITNEQKSTDAFTL